MGTLSSHHSRPTASKESDSVHNYNSEPERLPLGKKGDLYCPNGVAIGGQFVFVAEGGADRIARVSVFAKSGEFVTSFSNKYMVCPWSIAVHRENVYLTDTGNNSLFYFGDDEGYSLSRRVGGRGSGDTEFDCPIQVSVSPRGEVYVADKFNDRVQILDSGLKYLRSITHPSMSAPIGVRVLGDRVCVLSSPDSHIAHIFSVTGNMRSYRLPNSSVSNTDESISDNANFTLDTNNNIITRTDQLLQDIAECSGYGNKGGEEQVLKQNKSVGVIAINKRGLLHYTKVIKNSLCHLKIYH